MEARQDDIQSTVVIRAYAKYLSERILLTIFNRIALSQSQLVVMIQYCTSDFKGLDD